MLILYLACNTYSDAAILVVSYVPCVCVGGLMVVVRACACVCLYVCVRLCTFVCIRVCLSM